MQPSCEPARLMSLSSHPVGTKETRAELDRARLRGETALVRRAVRRQQNDQVKKPRRWGPSELGGKEFAFVFKSARKGALYSGHSRRTSRVLLMRKCLSVKYGQRGTIFHAPLCRPVCKEPQRVPYADAALSRRFFSLPDACPRPNSSTSGDPETCQDLLLISPNWPANFTTCVHVGRPN
jgi:hypothetical protein